MRRREFIAGLGGAAAWPVVARAQQPAMPVVGVLSATASPERFALASAFVRHVLAEAGYVVGSNVAIEDRNAEGQLDRLPILAAELVRRQVAVIVALGPDAAQAAKYATTTIPIVFFIDQSQIEYYMEITKRMPGPVLTRHQLVRCDGEGYRLVPDVQHLTPHERRSCCGCAMRPSRPTLPPFGARPAGMGPN